MKKLIVSAFLVMALVTFTAPLVAEESGSGQVLSDAQWAVIFSMNRTPANKPEAFNPGFGAQKICSITCEPCVMSTECPLYPQDRCSFACN